MMQFWSRILAGLRYLLLKQEIEGHLDDEVRSCVDMVADEKIAAGMSPSEARRMATAEFGGIEQTKQAVRDGRAGAFLELCWQDAPYAFRELRKSPRQRESSGKL